MYCLITSSGAPPTDDIKQEFPLGEIEADFLVNDVEYGEFFLNAPQLNPNRKMITGKICGIRVEEIEEPLMQEIRYLDKLVDELARGKTLEKILRK